MFRIQAFTCYIPWTRKKKTKKLRVMFTCRLWDEQGNFTDVKNWEAVIAVAYP